MTTTGAPGASAVAGHDGEDCLGERLLEALAAAGYDVEALTPEQLKPIDQVHIGGPTTTRELAALAGLRPGTTVLDVGGGLGGPARMLASEFGCTVTVLDLMEPYCRAGELLTERTGLSDRVSFQHGDALAMPFPDGSFDLVWTQHSSMNVADKRRLYAEFRRVVRPGGRLALHEVMTGPVQPVHFPVPWAGSASQSALVTADELRGLLPDLGFFEIAWIDVTPAATAMFRTAIERARANDSQPVLGLHLVLGETFPEMTRMMGRNLEEQRITVIQAVFDRPS